MLSVQLCPNLWSLTVMKTAEGKTPSGTWVFPMGNTGASMEV